ncbi:MAG: DUF4388 domain-containing protein [Candidatus Viridilinea halotolerans]|uniref:DUF4388 domain-containing protein n=1 Tax=Candidatus Viridilinea halotolerans TaxID=2491704 RepID=A0A426U512_9CHLR|nr:MAG: DUF4388 domain-containing protein [Candidatus Viridilinea halotolerans]
MFLQGSFNTISVAALIQTLCHERRAVQIEAWRTDASAHICLSDGLVIAATCEGTEGADAIVKLMRWPNGLFRVGQLPEHFAPTMAADPESILLEAARQRDEFMA